MAEAPRTSEQKEPEKSAAPAPGAANAGAPPGAEPPFEVVIEEDAVPLGQIDFRSYLQWKELDAARRAGAAAPRPLDVGPSASSLQKSVYSGVVSLLKIAAGISLLAAGVCMGVLFNTGINLGSRSPAPPAAPQVSPAPAAVVLARRPPPLALAEVADAVESARPAGRSEVAPAAIPRELPESPAAETVAQSGKAASSPAGVAVAAAPEVASLGTDEGEATPLRAHTGPAVATVPAPLPPGAAAPEGEAGAEAPRVAVSEPPSTLEVAASLAERGDLPAARAALESLLRKNPASAKALNNLGLLLLREGQTDRAEQLFKEALANDPSLAEAYVNLGNIHLGRGAFDLAELNYRQALKVRPALLCAHLNLVRAIERAGEIRDAEAEARRLVAEEGGKSPDAHAILGRLLVREGRSVEARTELERALALDPRHVNAELDLGLVRFEAGEKEAAKACFDRVIARAPNSAAAYNDRGTVYAALEKYDEAKLDYEHALEIDPAYVDAHFNYALVAEHVGQYVPALDEYERVIEIDPGYARALNNLGLIYSRGKRPQEALKYLDRAIAADPALLEARLNRGIVLIDLGRRADAHAELSRYAAALPAESQKRKKVEEVLAKLEQR